MQTNEITKTAHGSIVVATWEWRNGWNLISTRPATAVEVEQFKSGDGLPVKI